jgi:hypothetical protein
MTRSHARAQRFRLPPGEWARQHSVQLATLGVIVVLLFAWCNPPKWPTVIWQVVAHDCGTVQVVYARVNSSDATLVETCFAQAYRRCTAATLNADFFEVDYNPSYHFVIEPYGFTCAIGALWDFPIVTACSWTRRDCVCSVARVSAMFWCRAVADRRNQATIVPALPCC